VFLWAQKAKIGNARNLLQPIHDWFTEGFDTTDWIDAKALLDSLTP